MQLVATTFSGALYQSDCTDLLRCIPDSSVHTIFADPPFNLRKDYGANGSDSRTEEQYLSWCREWLDECFRVLAPGGALFVYNLPKWLIPIGSHLNAAGMTFRHWIAVYKPTSLPIPKRLSPSHYGLLYYVKGDKPRVFNRDAVRIPIRTCRHCHRDIKDYGGHKKHLNAKGLNLTDVWDDVRSIRHRKYKNRDANELDPVLVERAILMSTRKGDVVVDPFVGSGTTAWVAERIGRKWICGDLNDCSSAKDRLPVGSAASILDGSYPARVPRAFSLMRRLARPGEGNVAESGGIRTPPIPQGASDAARSRRV